jgi:hypothetical protein
LAKLDGNVQRHRSVGTETSKRAISSHKSSQLDSLSGRQLHHLDDSCQINEALAFVVGWIHDSKEESGRSLRQPPTAPWINESNPYSRCVGLSTPNADCILICAANIHHVQNNHFRLSGGTLSA